jgi:hypothetical protein
MKLGPIQELWLYRLENYPDRQGDRRLGELNEDGESYHASCLGEYLITYRRCNKVPFEELWSGDEGKDLFDNIHSGSVLVLRDSYKDLGLHSENGLIVGDYYDKEGNYYGSLSQLNDHGFTWPEIAAIIRDRPEDIFTKSL